MHTIFSYIIQKRFSQVNEDVATDALAYLLESSDAARRGMMKLLRGIIPDLPSLRFTTQQTEGAIRPDMWGLADHEPRVFVENKFWAGLTENQPVSYVQNLAAYPQPTVLLVIAPAAREHTLWRELNRRLADAGIAASEHDAPAGVAQSAVTELGPILALTSWTSVLSVMEHEAVDDPGARGDLVQLRALCDAADIDAFTPISAEEISDQRTPAFILQLGAIVQAAVDLAVAENVLDVARLRPQASWERIGRYVKLSGGNGAGLWFGIHFALWKSHGESPLWLLFTEGEFGKAEQVRRLIEPWAARKRILTATYGTDFAIALDIAVGEESAVVVRSLADAIRAISSVLGPQPPETVRFPAHLKAFVDVETWTFAKTYARTWPHEYIVRDRVDEDLFVQLVQHIRTCGYEGRFYNKAITYFDEDGLVYWTMGAPIEETTVVNRCTEEQTYEYRLRHGTLPESEGAG